MTRIERLITDDDILHGRVTSPIVLTRGTVITPAARDRARARGLSIVEEGLAPPTPAAASAPAASSCASCGGGGCSTCQSRGSCAHGASVLDGLPDGTYLIAVRDGQPVSILPSTGPGLMPRRR